MIAATAKFKKTGICELAREMQLSSLGSYITKEWREMTSKKRSHTNGKCFSRMAVQEASVLTPNQKMPKTRGKHGG